MATTPKGIYYPNDYNEIADIPEDMKKMAESIEEVFEDTDSDLSDIKEEQTTQNNRLNSLEVDNTTNKSDILTNKQEINNIKTEQTEQNTNISTNATNIESLQEENENLKKIVSQLPQVTGQGTEVTLENTIEAQFTKFDEEGNSTQETTEGRQLFNVTDYTNITLGNNSSASNAKTSNKITITTGSGSTASGSYITKDNLINYIKDYDSSQTYYVSMDVKTNRSLQLQIGVDTRPNFTVNTTARVLVETLINSNGLVIYSKENTAGDTIEITNIMISKSNNTEFEKYTGGIASPNPNYEQPIYSAGDNENLVNESNINFIYSSVNKVIYDNGLIKTINSPNGQFYEFDEPLESGETYTLTFKFVQGRVNVQGSQDFSIGMYHSGNNNSWQGNLTKTQIGNIDLAGKTFTLTHKATDTITGLYIFIYSSPTFVTPLWFNVKVEKGNKASGYSPYGMGSINEKISNKNFANNAGNGYIASDRSIAVSNVAFYNDFIPIPENENNVYYYGSNLSSSMSNVYANRIAFYNENQEKISVIGSISTPTSYTIPNGAKYVRASWLNAVENPMLVFGGAIPYVPHEEQDYSIYTQQPFRSIGNVRDKFVKVNGNWFERHYIAEGIFNPYNCGLNGGGTTRLRISMWGYQNLKETSVKSKYFPSINGRWDDNNEIKNAIYGWNSDGVIGVNIDKEIASTLDEFKTWASNVGLNFYYIRKNPLDLPCTEEQIQQLENLPSTYKEMTIIQSEDETPAYLEVAGIYDLNKLITRTEVLESEV